jgi:hypothetical protein
MYGIVDSIELSTQSNTFPVLLMGLLDIWTKELSSSGKLSPNVVIVDRMAM